MASIWLSFPVSTSIQERYAVGKPVEITVGIPALVLALSIRTILPLPMPKNTLLLVFGETVIVETCPPKIGVGTFKSVLLAVALSNLA